MTAPALHARYDVVIVGGGHNGLVAGGYLAQAGMTVLVLERLDTVGGATVSEESFAGLPVKSSPYATDVSAFPTRIVRDLDLDLTMRPRRTMSYTPYYRQKRHAGLFVETTTAKATADSFRNLTGLDREYEAYRKFQAEMAEVIRTVGPTFLEPLRKEKQARALLRPEVWDMLVEEPLGYTLEKRFNDDLVRGIVASDAAVGGHVDLHSPTYAANIAFLFHHLGYQQGPPHVPVGGMGAFSASLERTVWKAGGEIVTGAFVMALESDGVTSQITYRHGGVEHKVASTWVLANVAPWVLRILAGEQPGPRPEGGHLQFTMLLDRLPRLRADISGPVAFGSAINIGLSYEQILQSYAEAEDGWIPEMPPGRLYCNSLIDPSVLGAEAMEGRHLFTFQGFQAPARLFTGNVEHQRDEMVLRILDAINVHLEEPIESLVTLDKEGAPCLDALAPQDVESRLALPGGHWFQGQLSWPWAPQDSALETPAQRWGVTTPWPKVMLCGAGAKRGGGVTGVGGHNAAMAVLESVGRGVTPRP